MTATTTSSSLRSCRSRISWGLPSVAIGDIDDDGVYDLVVGAGKDHAPEVVAYSGKEKNGKVPFSTELARFQAFDAAARGGVSVASSQVDGTTADNIIVGSGPGIQSEVKVFSTKLPATLGTAPALFSTFNPYLDDRNGVSVASGFVDFTTGRYSIVTAPGPGSVAQVKVFNFSLMPLIDKTKKAGSNEECEPDQKKPAVTNSFMPFGMGYRGGLSLATGWLTGALGRRRKHCRGSVERRGRGKGLFERVEARRGARGLPCERQPYAYSPLRRDRKLRTIQGRVGRQCGDDEHNDRLGSSRQRHFARGRRASAQIRFGAARSWRD